VIRTWTPATPGDANASPAPDVGTY
jgi:hypothetical protein